MRSRLCGVLWILSVAVPAAAQNRGVYPLGMSATNSGVTPQPGFAYVNQLLFYARDHAKDANGDRLPVTGENYVLMDMNSLAWISEKTVLGGANFSMVATIPIARNSLSSDVSGKISGGGGLADSYYLPVIFGWNRDRVAIRAMYGFLAPTGAFTAGATDNVGSGYWTHTLSSGQTFYLTADKRYSVSAFEMYEVHTTQEGTGTRPGDTFDFDFSLMRSVASDAGPQWQLGVVGYHAKQTTRKTGPQITSAQSAERYAVHALGFGIGAAFPKQKANLGLRYFQEFGNRSTYEGYSLQLSGSIAF